MHEGLDEWLSRLLSDDAARERAREHWLRRQAEEEGSFAGVLVDLAERRRPVVVQLRSTRLVRGTIVAVGADFVGLACGPAGSAAFDPAGMTLVHLGAIMHVRPAGDGGGAANTTIGDRVTAGDMRLVEVLAAVVDERPRVQLVGDHRETAITGDLRAVGRDVATVRLDGGAGTAYVALDALTEVSFPRD